MLIIILKERKILEKEQIILKQGDKMKSKNKLFVTCRIEKGVTQIKMAEDLGVCKDYINMIENNRRTPGLKLAKRIAEYLDSSVDSLFF